MKKYILLSLLVLSTLLGSTTKIFAVKAYPYPFVVTQPDGSKITIQRFGDEYLSWTVANGRLVAEGPDGFYYNASFNVDGTIQRSSSRAFSSAFSGANFTSANASAIRPPQVAIDRALKARAANKPVRPAAGPRTKAGSHHELVLLVQYQDIKFNGNHTKQQFFGLFNSDSYSYSATGSVKQYFEDNSKGIYSPDFDVYGPYTLPHERAFYGGHDSETNANDKAPQQMILDAVTLAYDEGNVDFSNYSTDGIVDNITVIFAGVGEAESRIADAIWPHKYTLAYFTEEKFNGVSIGTYSCSAELNYKDQMVGIGTICHEFGHTLGLPDFYDTNYEVDGSASNTPRQYSLMDNGNYNQDGATPPYLSAMERDILGWLPGGLTPLETSGQQTLLPVSENQAYTTQTNNPDEFFIYEYRAWEGWDKGIYNSGSKAGGYGLLIYHVDQSNNVVGPSTAKELWASWDINLYGDHPNYRIIPANNSTDKYLYQNWPFKDNTSFTSTSVPAAKDWAGGNLGYELTDINVATDDSQMTFTFTQFSSATIYGTVTNANGVALKDVTVVITPQSSTPSTKADGVQWSMYKASGSSFTTTTDADGKYSYTFDDVSSYSAVSISVAPKGYNSYDNTFPIEPGTLKADVVLYTHVESLANQLKKHRSLYNSMRLTSGTNTYVATKFTSAELSKYQGCTIQSITIAVLGTTAAGSTMGVLLADATGRIYFTQDIFPHILGSYTTIDISTEHLLIPNASDLYIGWYVKNHEVANISFPFDDGYVSDNNGLYYSGNGQYWTNGGPYNLLISANVYDENKVLTALGLNVINNPKDSYQVGDLFTFEVQASDFLNNMETPSSTKWFFDNIEQTSPSISLTAGAHTIRVELTYADGRTDMVTQEINVTE